MLRSITAAALLLGLITAPATAQDAQSIIREMQQRQNARMSGVQDYLMVRNVAGTRVPTWHERISDGVYRTVPIDEILERSAQETGQQRPEMTHELADAYEMTGNVMRQELEREGFPAQGPLDPSNMFDPMAAFIRAGADREPLSDGREEALSGVAGMAEFGRRATLVGREQVEGTDTYRLRATDLGDIELDDADGVEFELVAANLYVETGEYVPVKMLIEVRARQNGDWMPMTIEKIDLAYRQYGPMYEPSEQVMRIGGMEAAMAEQMKEMEAQLAQLPAGMRSMVESQMRNAMKQFEAAVYIEEILVNTGVPTDEVLARMMMPPGGRP